MRFVLGLMWLLHWLPLSIIGRIGEAVGTLLFILLRSRRHIALTNLRICFPDLSESERVALAKRHFRAYVRSILERSVLWWAFEERLKKLIFIETEIPLTDIQSSPSILLCPHFVCLDVAGAAIALHMPACSVYVPQRNRIFDQALRRGRSRFHPVRLFARNDGIRPVMRAMREGLPFFMLPDMDFGPKDAEFVPFFGMPAATLTAPARLAATAGARVIPVVAFYRPDYSGWTVKIYSPWEDYPGSDLTAATRRMNAFIEDRVREVPAEYFWVHRRFKTSPAGRSNIYD